jgi:hypothetical protein
LYDHAFHSTKAIEIKLIITDGSPDAVAEDDPLPPAASADSAKASVAAKDPVTALGAPAERLEDPTASNASLTSGQQDHSIAYTEDADPDKAIINPTTTLSSAKPPTIDSGIDDTAVQETDCTAKTAKVENDVSVAVGAENTELVSRESGGENESQQAGENEHSSEKGTSKASGTSKLLRPATAHDDLADISHRSAEHVLQAYSQNRRQDVERSLEDRASNHTSPA